MAWHVLQPTDAPKVHVMPLGDALRHDSDEDCVCGPRAEAVFREDGSTWWLLVHPALVSGL